MVQLQSHWIFETQLHVTFHLWWCVQNAVAAPPLYALHAIGLSFFIRVRLQNQYCQVNNAMQLSYLFAISLDIFTFMILAFLPKS